MASFEVENGRTMIDGKTDSGRIRIVVFCGPPLSGKTTLARGLSGVLGAAHLQMDEFRKRLLPSSRHNRRDIDVAYRAMHYASELLALRGHHVIVESSYGRVAQRRDLETVAETAKAAHYVVQCKVSQRVAVERFRERTAQHPAVDLNEERVALLAVAYPFAQVGLILDTTDTVARCMKNIQAYLRECRPVSSRDWSNALQDSDMWPGPQT